MYEDQPYMYEDQPYMYFCCHINLGRYLISVLLIAALVGNATFKPGICQLQAGVHLILDIILVQASACVCVCVSVCVSTPEDINNQWRHVVYCV